MASLSYSETNFPFPVVCSAFQLPRGPPKYFNIKKALGTLSIESTDKLTTIQSTRDQLATLWGEADQKTVILPQSELSSLAPASELLACISSYYPLLLELMVSVGADPDSIRIMDSICVEWPSPLTRTRVNVKLTTIATGKHLLGALYMESCMLLVNRAFLLAEEARTTVGTLCNATSEFKSAAEKLCRAAGILDFVAFKIENDWCSGLSDIVAVDQRPLETTPALCIGLRDVYIAQAQGMAVAQAVASGSAKPSVLCKLAQGVLQHLNKGLAKLESMPYFSNITGIAAKGVGQKHSPITQYWYFYRSVWGALAYRFAAAVEWEKCAYGKAVAYQEKAVNLSNADQTPFLGELALITPEVSSWRRNEAATLNHYKQENSTIYYDPVPALDRLEPLPAAATIMKPVPFTEPEVVPFAVTPADGSALPPPPSSSATSASVPDDISPFSGQSAAQRRLEGMGFETNAVRLALSMHNQNEQAAIEQLLSST